MTCMPNYDGHVISDKYMANLCEADVIVGCVVTNMCKILGLYDHLVCWLCELYLHCGSYIHLVICHVFTVLHVALFVMIHVFYEDNINGHFFICNNCVFGKICLQYIYHIPLLYHASHSCSQITY